MYYFIYNPTAGGGNFSKQLPHLKELLAKKFPNHYFATTVEPKDAVSLTKQAQAQGYKTVVVIGGDGTVHEVIQGLAYSDIALGIIPTGYTNSLAHKIKLPLNYEQALSLLLIRKQQTFDLGQINQRLYFVNSLNFGIHKKPATKGALNLLKKILLMEHTLDLLPTSLDLKIDTQYISSEAAVMSIANVSWPLESRCEELIPDPFDGKLNLFIFANLSDQNKINHFKTQEKILKSQENLTYFTISDTLIDKYPLSYLNIDGEDYELMNQLKVRCVSKCLNIIVP